MSVLSFIGRLLIATALISSAYLHYQHPAKSVSQFSTNYKVIDALSDQYLEFDLPFDNTNWAKIVKIFGGFEAVIAFLVIFGDRLGGAAYLTSLIFELFFLLWPKILANSVHILGAWRSSEKQEASRLICFIGIALLLLSINSAKRTKATK